MPHTFLQATSCFIAIVTLAANSRSDELHWAYQPIQRPALPVVANDQHSRNPIDRFVVRRLDSEDLRQAEQADSTTLIRRVSLALR